MAWLYKRSITIDHTKCGTADSTNFPVTFFGIYDGTGGEPDLRSIANGGKVAQANGYDIAFYSDSALTQLLDFERVYWSASTGQVEFWIRVPTLDVDANTVIYMAYGDSGASDLQDATGTWNANYKGVWHLPDGSTLSANDSTGVYNGTITGATAIAGQMNGGANFDGNDYINYGSSIVNGGTVLTLEAWIKTTMTGTGQVLTKWSDSASQQAFVFQVTSNKMRFLINATNGTDNVLAGLATVNDGNWHHVVATYDSNGGANNQKIYVDGALDNQRTADAGYTSSTDSLYMGRYTGNSGDYVGTIDEGRVLAYVLSLSWITAEYNNQSSPSTFYTIGSEEVVSASFVPKIIII